MLTFRLRFLFLFGFRLSVESALVVVVLSHLCRFAFEFLFRLSLVFDSAWNFCSLSVYILSRSPLKQFFFV